MKRLMLVVLLAYLAPFGFLSAQDQEKKEDPYSDYSHLWAEGDKKKRRKRKVNHRLLLSTPCFPLPLTP